MLKESVTINHSKFVFTENHGRRSAIFNYPLSKNSCASWFCLSCDTHRSTKHWRRDSAAFPSCSSIITQQKWKTRPTLWSNQLLSMASTKNCKVLQLFCAMLRSDQFWVTSSDTLKILWALQGGIVEHGISIMKRISSLNAHYRKKEVPTWAGRRTYRFLL